MNRLLWPGLIFILIGAIVIVDVSMLAIATANPPRIVTDSNQLPWSVHLAEAQDVGAVALDVLDPGGRAAADVTVLLKARDGQRAPVVRQLSQSAPGRFETLLPVDLVAPRLEITVSRGGRFVHRELIDMPARTTPGDGT